jgi:tetratricopeptide (TPR) repeat protein
MLRCPEPRRIGPSRVRDLIVWLILMSIPFAAIAAKKSYRYEDDPNRLGMKAIEEGRYEDAQKLFDEAIANEYQIYKAHLGLAQIKALQGNYADAEPLFRLALMEKNQETGSPDFPEAHANLGLVLLRLTREAEAKQEFDLALREKGNIWEAQYGMARVLISEQKYDEAAKFLEKGAKKKGALDGEDFYRYGMALVQLAQGDLPAAEKNALAALNLNPGDPDYGTLVADIYSKRGAPTLAIEAYEKALATPGVRVTAPIRRNLGILYQKEAVTNRDQALFTKARDQYQEAVKIDSTYAPAWRDLADLMLLAKRYEEAAGAYLRYSSLRRDDAAGFLGFAESALKLRGYSKPAYEAAQQAFKIDSTTVRSRLLLARSAFQAKDRATAARVYGTVSDSTQFEATDYLSIGQMRLEQKDFAGAGRALEKSVAMDSTSADAFFSLGLLNLNQQKPDSALVRFQKSVSLAPNNMGGWLNMGIAQLQLKQNKDAVGSLRRATQLSPDFAQAHVYLGNALLQVDSLTAATTEFKAAREKDPKNLGALRGLAFCYLKRGDYGQAVIAMKDATNADPSNADNWMMLGRALVGSGNNAGAIDAFKKVLELKPDNKDAKDAIAILTGANKGGK